MPSSPRSTRARWVSRIVTSEDVSVGGDTSVTVPSLLDMIYSTGGRSIQQRQPAFSGQLSAVGGAQFSRDAPQDSARWPKANTVNSRRFQPTVNRYKQANVPTPQGLTRCSPERIGATPPGSSLKIGPTFP